MSALAEHIELLRRLKAKDRPLYSIDQQHYQSQAFLTIDAHLEEIASLQARLEKTIAAHERCKAYCDLLRDAVEAAKWRA